MYAVDISLVRNDSAKAAVSITGGFFSQSSVLTNTFASKFILFPGYISADLKNGISSKLKNENRFGLSLNYGMSYFQKFNRKDLGFFITAENKEYFNTKFSGDFYNLAMYGNKRFVGTTANFDGLSLNYLRYQKIGAGVIWTAVDTVAKLGVGFSYLNGERNYSLHADRGRLFTSDDGQYLNLETSVNWKITDTLNSKRFAGNGYGFSTDFFFEAPFNLKKHSGKIVVNVEDLGFINWNKNAREYNADSTYYFDGIEVNNIFQLRDSVFNSLSVDSVGNVLNKSSRRVTTLIPANFNLYTVTNYGDKFQFIKGINYLFNANYKLLYLLKGNFIFSEKFSLSLGASYGGYTGFSGNIGIDKTFGKGLQVRLYSNNIEGFIAPDKTYAQSVFLLITKSFF